MVRDVTTVSDLQERLQEVSGQSSESLQGNFMFQGKPLDPSDVLRRVGVKEGATLTLITENEQLEDAEALFNRLFDSMPGNDEDEDQLDLQTVVDIMRAVQRDDVARYMREGFESIYYYLREAWDKQKAANVEADSKQMEAMRKLILNNPKAKQMVEQMKGGEELLQSPERWREFVLELIRLMRRAGDEILSGMLDVLLDVLKGAGKKTASANGSDSHAEFQDLDPSVASNVLFELSESEDDE